jgi:SAM-dependent methyltransferase
MPPLEMMKLVGPTDPKVFDNPTGAPVFGDQIDTALYESVFDFGCGCGRLARQLIQQDPRPESYLGIDLHQGLVNWCERNLTPHAPEFRFEHHAVYNRGFNPDDSLPRFRELPAPDNAFSLCIAWSVFTHTTQEQTEFYLAEVARILRPGGVLNSTWFLFEKRFFPMMQDFQQTLYINDIDPTNATIHDSEWVMRLAREHGLVLVRAIPPVTRGYQWVLQFTPARPGLEGIELPEDVAPLGRNAPPLSPAAAHKIGLDESH